MLGIILPGLHDQALCILGIGWQGVLFGRYTGLPANARLSSGPRSNLTAAQVSNPLLLAFFCLQERCLEEQSAVYTLIQCTPYWSKSERSHAKPF